MKGLEKKKKRKKKGMALLLCAALLCQTVLLYSTQAAQGADGLCPHHPAHTPECGYQEAAEGAPCAHQHTDACYQTVQQCIHTHTEECYPLIPAEAAVTAEEAAAEGQMQDLTAPAEPAPQVRADEPTACTHVCSEESGCITKTEACMHAAHDESCGYQEAQEASPCQFVCEECIREEEAQRLAEEKARQAAEGVQNLINALPEAGAVTPDNLEAVKAQLADIDGAKAQLAEAQQALLDMTRYQTAAEQIAAVEAQLLAQEEAEQKEAAVENPVARVTIGDTVTEYTDITAAFAAANGKTATIELLEDTAESEYVDVTVNSGTITVCGSGQIKNGVLFNEGADLTVWTGIPFITCFGGTTEVAGGSIQGIAVSSGAAATVTGGTIELVNCLRGTISVAGGSIQNVTVSVGAGAIITGGTISGRLQCHPDSTVELKAGTVNQLMADGADVKVYGGSIAEITYGRPVFIIDTLTLDQTELTLMKGNTAALTAAVTPVISAPGLVTWESSDPAVAAVGENGTVTATAGDKSASCKVTVKEAGGKAPQLTLDYEGETINTTADMEYSTDGDTWTPCTDEMTVFAFGWDGSAPKTVWIREKATETQFAGASAEVTIPARPQLTVSGLAEGITASTLAAEISGGFEGSDLQYSLSEASGTQVQDWQGVPESGEVLFENLKAGTEYIVEAYCSATDQSFEGWNSATVRTADAQYTISIPEKAQAGGGDVQIKVDNTEPFALGYGGKVTVQAAEGITDGAVTLIREGDPGHTLTSAVLVNGAPFSEEESIAVFGEASTESAVRISFAQPQEEGPAGYYSGIVTFAVEYYQ